MPVLAGACSPASRSAVPCAGCAGGDSPQELKTASDQTRPEKRAQIRLQLAIGYYQDRKYEIALDESSRRSPPTRMYADAYGVRALIYTAMGENAWPTRTTGTRCAWRRAIRTWPTTTGCSCATPAASRPRPWAISSRR
jgi:Tfp pilus assembly protein PilF